MLGNKSENTVLGYTSEKSQRREQYCSYLFLYLGENMIGKKHLRDYTLEPEMNEKGKIVEKPKYIGDLFELENSNKEWKKVQKKVLLLHIFSWIILWGSLTYYSPITHVTYIIISFTLILFVLLFQATAVYTMFHTTFPCKRREKEKIKERFMGSLIIELFFVIWTMGEILVALYMKIIDLAPSNLLFMAAVILLFIIAWLKLKLGKQFNLKKVEKEIKH